MILDGRLGRIAVENQGAVVIPSAVSKAPKKCRFMGYEGTGKDLRLDL